MTPATCGIASVHAGEKSPCSLPYRAAPFPAAHEVRKAARASGDWEYRPLLLSLNPSDRLGFRAPSSGFPVRQVNHRSHRSQGIYRDWAERTDDCSLCQTQKKIAVRHSRPCYDRCSQCGCWRASPYRVSIRFPKAVQPSQKAACNRFALADGFLSCSGSLSDLFPRTQSRVRCRSRGNDGREVLP
jgi:hypothetical protein